MGSHTALTAIAILSLISYSGTVQGARAGDDATLSYDWPEFHGPHRDSKSNETALLTEWPSGGPRLLWTASGLGIGYSTVSIARGTIYTAGKSNDTTFVLAFDLAGRPKWRAANGRSWKATKRQRWAVAYSGARATPTVNDGLVYHLGELGRLAAYSADTGQEVWALNVVERFNVKLPQYGYAESVLIDGDLLVCYPGGVTGYMVALNKATGEVVWANRNIGDPASYCSPIVVQFGGFRQIITMTTVAMVGVDVRTGEELWRFDHGNKRGVNATTPIYQNGHVYATSGYGKGGVMVKLAAHNGRIKAEEVWRSNSLDNHHGGVVLVDGYLYGAGHHARGWHCLDFKTGEPRYSGKGVQKGSVAYADRMLYCLGEKGVLALVRATPEGQRIVSEFRVPEGGEGLYWAHPVICGGRLYIRHADRLYAYDISAR